MFMKFGQLFTLIVDYIALIQLMNFMLMVSLVSQLALYFHVGLFLWYL